MTKTKYLTIILSILLIGQLFAQNQNAVGGKDYNAFTKIPPPYIYTNRSALNKVSADNFEISYSTDFPETHKAPFKKATDILNYLMVAPKKIRIHVIWDDIQDEPEKPAPLAFCTPEGKEVRNFANSDTNYCYILPLAEKIANSDLNGTNKDIEIHVNKNISNWYLGTDGNTPAEKYDFVTVMMHEIIHGLGFYSSLNIPEYSDIGKYGVQFSNGNSYPVIFDSFIKCDIDNTWILDKPNNSFELGGILIDSVSGLSFVGEHARSANKNRDVKLYLPSIWNGGSSVSHLDEDTFPEHNANSLMTPFFAKAEAIHSPGPITLGVLKDMGWNINELLFPEEPYDNQIIPIEGGAFSVKLASTYESQSIWICLYKKGSPDPIKEYMELVTSGYNTFTLAIPNNIEQDKEYKIKIKSATKELLTESTGYFVFSNVNRVTKPVFSPSNGTYGKPLTVTITSADSSKIYYKIGRTKGILPDDPDSTKGTLYDPNNPPVFNDPGVLYIKARAYKNGLAESEVAIASYEILNGITLRQVSEDGNIFGNIKYYHLCKWKTAPNNRTLPLVPAPTWKFKAEQEIVLDSNEKFYL